MLTPLNRKLLRELGQLKGQMASIALVVAVGIMTVVTMRGSYDSLVQAQQAFYRESRFADVWVSLVRAPQSLLLDLEAIPGIQTAESRVNALATLDLDDSGSPAQGRFVSIPAIGRPALNDLRLDRGRYLEPGALNEVIINTNFADARGYQPGDRVRAIINGSARELQIVGIGNSPEHIYSVPPGSLYPEDERYGVFWANRDLLGPAYELEGAFNEAFFSLTAEANEDAVIDEIDRLLEPYGGLGAYPRSGQPSHLILQSELDQNRISGAVIPLIFLAVAVFLLYIVLGRLIATQRGEIAVLKAFGYSNFEIGQHFLMFAVVAVLLGGIIGSVGGVLLGEAYIEVYRLYFKLPDLRYEPSLELLSFAFFSCVFGAFAGAIAAIVKAIRLPPAEAMRPEAPPTFKPGLIDRLGLNRLIGPTGQMIIRNMERKPVQSLFSVIGVAMATAILTLGFFMFDSVNLMMDMQFRQIQREDLNLTFREILPDSVRFELAALPGVNRVETQRVVSARLRAGHREDEVAIQGVDGDAELRRIVNRRARKIPVPGSGIVISTLLAERLQVQPGDELIVEVLEGKRRQFSVELTGLIDDYLGLSAIMEKTNLWRHTDEPGVVNSALLTVESNSRPAINSTLKGFPVVTGVSSPDSMLESFKEQLADSILIASGFLLGFAGVIAVGVIYNAARISLSERGRELASLRVMGLHRREVAALLLGEQALLTLVAIPLGWLIGYGISYAISRGLRTDIYRIPFVVDTQTLTISAMAILLAAAVSARIVRRRLDQISLVEVLKTRE